MATEYPPTLTPEQHNFLLTSLTDWSLCHGLTVRPQPVFVRENPNNALATHAPVACFPSVFPREPFVRARDIQVAYNELYAGIASAGREEWLGGIIEEIASVDEFIAQLWKVYKEVKAEGFVQVGRQLCNFHFFQIAKGRRGLFRSDYMVHVDPNNANAAPEVHQVEFNTIASSFGGLATRVSQMHKHLYRIGAYGDAPYINEASLPDNPATSGLADGLAKGHNAYGEGVVSKETAILFLVQDGERNAFDQRWLEYSLLERHGIKSYRITFSEIPLLTTLHADTRSLLYHPPQRPSTSLPIEITTVYFRAGYGPSDYPTPQSWVSRAHIERSRAIKCPTILTQLAGSKKVQQVLAAPTPPPSSSGASSPPSILSTFLPHASPETLAKLESTFARIYPLDTSPLGLQARKIALDPERAKGYVLKPQREGGGNNIYKSKIPEFLKGIPEEHWSGYILMELIVTPGGVRNMVLKNGQVMEGEVVGELGVYGVCLWDAAARKDGKEPWVKVNKEVGWLLRTKGSASEEGGVAAGFGCVDSVVLVD
ncbi:hypothetical protein EV426DRAFT_675210 [Tirmania nivea]|nr:hypothetical protein EV426DRAFT_675210 [Tirmania nivea]